VEDERRAWKEGKEFEILNFCNFVRGGKTVGAE